MLTEIRPEIKYNLNITFLLVVFILIIVSYNGSGGEEVGVVAALLEVHDNVEQRNLVSSSFGVEGLKVFRQDKFVVLPTNRRHKRLHFSFSYLLHFFPLFHLSHDSLLHGAELHSDDELCLGGHVLEDVGLQPPEHVWTQHVVQLLDLVLLSNVSKLLQEALQVAADTDVLVTVKWEFPVQSYCCKNQLQ